MVCLHQSFMYCRSLQTPAVLHPAQKHVKLREEITSPVVSTPGFTLCMDLVPGIHWCPRVQTTALCGCNLIRSLARAACVDKKQTCRRHSGWSHVWQKWHGKTPASRCLQVGLLQGHHMDSFHVGLQRSIARRHDPVIASQGSRTIASIYIAKHSGR